MPRQPFGTVSGIRTVHITLRCHVSGLTVENRQISAGRPRKFVPAGKTCKTIRGFLPRRNASDKLNVRLNPKGLGNVGIGVTVGDWMAVSGVSRERG